MTAFGEPLSVFQQRLNKHLNPFSPNEIEEPGHVKEELSCLAVQ